MLGIRAAGERGGSGVPCTSRAGKVVVRALAQSSIWPSQADEELGQRPLAGARQQASGRTQESHLLSRKKSEVKSRSTVVGTRRGRGPGFKSWGILGLNGRHNVLSNQIQNLF